MSYKSESAFISATVRIPNRSFLELTILRSLKLQLLILKGWRLSYIAIIKRYRFQENRLFALSMTVQKIRLLTHILKLAVPCKKSFYFCILCPLIIGLDKAWKLKVVIYLCGTYFELAKEGEAQKTECEDVVFLYQVKMLQKRCVL